MKTSRNGRCWVKWAFRLSLGCLHRRYSVFHNLRILSIVIRHNFGIMYYLSLILIRTLPCIHGCQDEVRNWQDLAKTAKMLVKGSTRDSYFQNIIQSIFEALWFQLQQKIFAEVAFLGVEILTIYLDRIKKDHFKIYLQFEIAPLQDDLSQSLPLIKLWHDSPLRSCIPRSMGMVLKS